MTDSSDQGTIFVTVAMAEILLNQNLTDDARTVIDELLHREPDNPRVAALKKRLEEIPGYGSLEEVPMAPADKDTIMLETRNQTVRIEWTATEKGLALARRRVRYSGKTLVRLFSAVRGPRGVRTATRDLAISHLTARLDLNGLPRPAVHVAAVGFLANTGEFVPLARSEPLVVS